MRTKDIHTLLQEYYFVHQPVPRKVRVSGVSQIQAGWESDIYAFDLLADDHEPLPLILRIYPGADALEKSEREYRNLRLLDRAGFPVPKAYLLERESSPFGNPFTIIERIPGDTLWETLFSAKGKAQQDLIDAFSSLFVQLHSLDIKPFENNRSADMEFGTPSVVESQLLLWRKYYENFPLPDFLPLFEWLETHLADIQTSKPAVLHWDFHPENIILQPDGAMVVIDWTGLQVSDLRFDLAWTLMLIAAYEGEHWRGPFLESYERAAGKPVSNLEFFDVAAGTRRLFSIVVSINEGAEKLGMRPGAEETMRNQIEPIRSVYKMLLKRTGIELPSIETWISM
jgi:aminoglycoside phosphotransferase (APT) family kinase protein